MPHAKKFKQRHGLPGVMKKKTLIRYGLMFFRNVTVRHLSYPEDLCLICRGMYISQMLTEPRVTVENESQYALLIGDFFQARFEPYGAMLLPPFKENDSYVYIVGSYNDLKERYQSHFHPKKRGNRKEKK